MFKKRPISAMIQCDRNEFCKVETLFSNQVNHKFHYIIQRSHYAFLSQDGRDMGMPAPIGGKIYPFSEDPSRQGSRKERKRFTVARLTVIHNQFKVKVDWGTGPSREVKVLDSSKNVAFVLGASGSFSVQLDPADMGQSANKFYRTLVENADLSSNFDAMALQERLADLFIQNLGESIDAAFADASIKMRDGIIFTTGEMGIIAKHLSAKMKNIYAENGLILSDLTITNMVIRDKCVQMGDWQYKVYDTTYSGQDQRIHTEEEISETLPEDTTIPVPVSVNRTKIDEN
ncbi:MAG: hypothetical protein IJW46_01260 [Clostridia bacterium]|nr:hypothetical protein [Clostridia bacterium]